MRSYAAEVRKFLCLGMLACGVLAGCALAPRFPAEKAPMQIASLSEGYLLEPGNRVRIIVFGENNLSGDFALDSAGNLALPLVGIVAASGTTSKILGQRIEQLLKKDNYLQDPKVSVEIQTFRPFYVLGEVRQPGEFPYVNGMTVLSAVAKAGGYDYRAWEGEVVLVRTAEGEQKEYTASERTPIQPGDVVRVMQRRL